MATLSAAAPLTEYEAAFAPSSLNLVRYLTMRGLRDSLVRPIAS